MEKTTRDAVAEAFDKAGVADTESEVAEVAHDPAEPAAAVETHGETAEAAEPAPKAEKPGAPVRGPDGKFQPKNGAKTPAPVAAEPPAPGAAALEQAAAAEQPPAAAAAPAMRPPQDWSAKAKAVWDKLPREAQEEAHRLHVETKRVLQESAQARQAAEAWQKTLAPYDHVLRASGKPPQEAVGWLVQQYTALQTAPFQQRARIIADLQRQFLGTDEQALRLLASELDAAPAQTREQPQGLRPEQVQELVRQEAQRLRAEEARQSEVKAIQDFEAESPEFLGNVTQEIAAIVTLAKQQGQPITKDLLRSAYDRAVRLNPEVAAILKQRDDAAAAAKKAQTQTRAAAATSLRSEPGGPVGGTARPKTTREQVAELMAKAEGGRRA